MYAIRSYYDQLLGLQLDMPLQLELGEFIVHLGDLGDHIGTRDRSCREFRFAV